ncbi:MAG: hypothetical protein K2G69_06855 [Muribaculaceae bacterium]|nr:hypothetical protein [Muribaculaceae bacterium]
MKTKRLFVRMTSEEHQALKKSAAGFNSMSQFVKEAIKEFSGQSPKKRLELRNRVIDHYTFIDSKLAHIGGNLNQAMHRCNELAKAGLPTPTIIVKEVYPNVKECHSLLIEVRNLLYEISDELTK